ncbi:hypothetical protein NAL32_08350 [Chryseobacterium sp. Ch-15]|uniref:Gliding motility-associated C-terminal domain-containing protein n=1 Tax=Chryseobacterium muglaense TaxID=2893752 RepID=A0A9Q3UXM8_9FLAO|nr:hypothetical protein [Chryseobacterium muglaense]MBD3903036.1 hypothetical protein [Chryseobacterium muglaense]MCC9035868.1 hypothetical protein [Chryseobacterium muglaense]MCM2554403.1 hypothetical protein [Chryseobacterium muglaense]
MHLTVLLTEVGKELYRITPTTPIAITSLELNLSTWALSSTMAMTFRLEGSVDGISWTGLSGAVSSTATTGTFTVTNTLPNNIYGYYRLVGVAGTSYYGGVTEIRLVPNNYIPSAHPKTSCTDANIDSDGILPHFDLDSDGDGCSDAFEGGATSNLSTNYKFTGAVGTNGLDNTLENSDSGNINYTSTYIEYAISSSIKACIDSDGDGILDIYDVDDDNDGILDTTEQRLLDCENAYNISHRVVTWQSVNSSTMAGSLIVNGENISITATTTKTFQNLQDSHWGYGSGSVVGCPDMESSATNSAINIYTGNYTVTYTFSKPVRNPSLTFSSFNGSPVNFPQPVYVSGLQGTLSGVNIGSYITSIPATENKVAVIYNGVYNSISFTVPTNENQGAVMLYIADSETTDTAPSLITTGSPFIYKDIDTDKDGIPNRLDLDSDGDGCSDLAESGVSPSTDISTPSSTTNNAGGNYGIAPNKLTGSQLNPTATDVNNDGLNDSVDPDTNGSPNYSSTYNLYALANNLNTCADTDNDGILDLYDIDDDNDGVLDAVESPNCFYKESEGGKVVSVTTELSPYSTTSNGIGNSFDNNTTTYSQFANAQNWVGKSIVEITPKTPLAISSVNFLMGVNSLSSNTSSTFKLQGWNGITWTNLSSAMASTTTADFSLNNTLQLDKIYSKYRVVGVAGTSQYGGIKEITLTAYQYNPSSHPKPTCSNDSDGDNVLNHLDLDSDGDGCPDAVEAGVVNKVGVANTSTGTVVNTPANGGTQNNVSQAIVGNGLPASYGNNGFYTGIESNDTFAATYTGTYIYNQYAIVSTINACTDTDGDGVIDVIDIDDDNDGVLDIIESPACAMTLRDDNANRLVWDFEGNLHTLPTTDYNVAQTQPYTSRTFGPGVVDVSGANVLRFTGATETNFDDAVTNGDYMQYYFTTSTKYLSIDKVVNGSFAPANLKQGVIISTDPTFATYTVLDRGEVPFTDITPVLNNDLTTYDNYSLNINTKYYVRFVYYGLTGTTQSAIDAVGLSFDEISNPQDCINGLDLDNDGIPNQLDLDSDGDGCPDTKEAILYNHSTEASTSGNVQNGNGGAVTSTVSTPNAMVPGPYGSNGFAIALQSTSDPDAYKYVYSYQFVATDADVNTCDNKFLSDIDSDDDGIPDAVESPSCFYTEAQAMDITEGVTSDFTWVATNPLSNTYDDNTTTAGAISAATAVSIQNKVLVTFDLPVIDAALIDNVKLNVGSVAFGGSATTGKWKLQGLDMNTALWTDLSNAAGLPMNTANTIYTFTNTLQPTIKYHKYRIIGIDNVSIANNAQLKEFSIVYKNYNPSLHRTKTGCNSDLDNDGVPNYLDRDSDGDGCPDAIEAGISKSLLVPANFFNVGGQVSGTHVIVGGTYGDNGLSNDVETPADSGILNYASTYNLYATDKDINLCTDTDNDGVPDVLDLDDDNDGILDAVESPNCFYTAAEAIIPVKISTGITTSTVNSVAVTPGNDIPTMHDTTTGSVTASNHVVPANQLGTTSVVIYKIEYPTRLGLTQMVVTGNAVSWGAGSFAILEASNTDITYEAVSDPLATNSTSATKTWLVNNSLPTAANLYKYYRIRVSTVGSTQLTFTNYEVTGTLKTTTYAPSAHTKHGCVNDTDGDGISNHQDLDSDGDTCPDAAEAGTATQVGAGNAYSGTIVNVSGSSVVENAVVGAAGSYGINGFYNGIESNDTLGATYTGTYTYANAINAAISACFCYKPAITTGTVLDTNHGITSLQRAGTDNGNWPMVRKGAWTALESKTKPFVPNRLTNAQVAAIPSANLVKGMMVFNIDLDCLQININGTPVGWKCFDKQTCPTN